MSEITFDRRNINNCLQQRFSLPTYQRDFKWEKKHLGELLNDMQEAFISEYDEGHGRKEVAKYTPYFLGTIITTVNPDASKTIIDGQQRLTTILAILVYFHRIRETKPEAGISEFIRLIRREVFGETQYTISFDEPRKNLFDLLMDSSIPDDELPQRVDTIPNLDNGSKKIFECFTGIDDFLETKLLDALLPNFIDFLTERVLLFEIVVPNEQDAHKVFVTMNDRGLKLGPIDLLKGYLLSNIFDDDANKNAHEKWASYMNKLKEIHIDEDSAFFKTHLRSKYAETSRGKKRGDEPGDFDHIGDSYHRWLLDNKNRIGLNTTDDFYTYVANTIPNYADLYIKIKQSETNYNHSFSYLYYNGVRYFTLQTMVILASIKDGDTTTTIDKKIKSVGCYIDYYLSLRFFNNKDNTYDNVKDYVFNLCKSIREKDLTDLKTILLQEIERMPENISLIKNLTYKQNSRRQDLLHTLSRIATYLEDNIELTNSVTFPVYVDRYRSSRTFDIEHILTNNIDIVKDDLKENYDFDSDQEFISLRDNIGALVLLPRGRNRSLQNKGFADKISVYGTENILALSLINSFYRNNPLWDTFSLQSGVQRSDISIFNKMSIIQRQDFYYSVAKLIWNKNNIERILS